MAEWRPLISEWLAEYASLQESEVRSFAAEHEHNHEMAAAVHGLLCDERDGDTNTNSSSDSIDQDSQLLESVCTQLFSFYRSREVELQRFCLQFLPSLVSSYLGSVARGDKRTCRCIETLLIGLYNFEVVDESGKPKVVSFRLPSLAQASIYHEPLSLAPQFLTESALRRWEECNTKLVSWGPLPQVEVLNAQNRLKVMTALLFVFNRQLSLLPKMALRHLCTAASRIVTQGFNSSGGGCGNKPPPRIPVSSGFLLELVHGAYFAMFNEFYTLALQAVVDVDRRGRYELMPEVMLVTGAVLNSLQNNPSGQPCDGPMGITLALSPATTTLTVSKSMITNASFRTKKLPDDIPIQAGAATAAESGDTLSSITEEAEAEPAAVQRGALRASKPKLPAFPGLGKKAVRAPARNGTEKRVTLKEAKGTSGGDAVDSSSPQPQRKPSELLLEAERNGSAGAAEERSLVSDSLESSDTHSHMTSDSLEMEAPRLAPMQVSSV